MSLLANIIGFSFVGLAARLGHLGIQKRNLFSNPGGHVLAMGAFGYVGYWAHYWEIHSSEMIQRKLEKIKESRQAKTNSNSE